MVENTARLLLYKNDEFFAEKASGSIKFVEAEFSEEEIPEEALAKKAEEAWGIEPKKLKLLCVLPKNSQDLIHYYACRDWSGDFENAEAEEIVSLGFDEISELSERTDAFAVQALEKLLLGKGSFETKASVITEKKHELKVSKASTEDFEIMPAVPKGMGRKQPEHTREGIDYEILSRGAKPKPVKQKKTII